MSAYVTRTHFPQLASELFEAASGIHQENKCVSVKELAGLDRLGVQLKLQRKQRFQGDTYLTVNET